VRDAWRRATISLGLRDVRLYEGTKHTMATDAVRRGVSERALQTFLGHKDVRSTRRYARMPEHAIISVLGSRLGGSSVVANPSEKAIENRDLVVVPTGVEPVSPG
jgi:hypothetical protein